MVMDVPGREGNEGRTGSGWIHLSEKGLSGKDALVTELLGGDYLKHRPHIKLGKDADVEEVLVLNS